MVNPLCKTYDQKSGNCLSCYQGYSISNGQCIFLVVDSNCKIFSNQLHKCIECIHRYFYDEKKCSMVSGLCKGYNLQTGKCTECYQGYSLLNEECNLDTKRVIQNCKSQNNDVCVACADFYYLNQASQCVQRNPLCKTFNALNGQCTSCYAGY